MTRQLAVVTALGAALGVGLAAQSGKAPAAPQRPAAPAAAAAVPAIKDWPTVGHDPGSMKFSPLTQITPQNVSQLATAWTYDMGIPAAGYTVTPIVVGNVMYFPVGTTIVGLQADSGKELWKFDLKTAAASRTGRERRASSRAS
jgi:quinoprotein glucose dehydrogenase